MPIENPPIKKPKQFHVEVVCCCFVESLGVMAMNDRERWFAKEIEDAYQRINDMALAEGMVIVKMDQALTGFGEAGLCMTITVQRVNRRDLQEAQMREAMGQRLPGPIGRG